MPTRQAGRSRNLGRLSEIAQVAARHGFGYVLRRNRLGDLLTGGNGTDGTGAVSDRGRRLREMLDELGPTFVKFGQLLSTRPDVVPPDIVIELRGLQDDVKPFPFEHVRTLEFMDPRELVDEFARSIRLELDYGHEARNAQAFRRNFDGDSGVLVPRVVRQYSTARILTLEYLHGTKVSELDLAAMEPDLRRDVAYRMADTWMTMVFRHGFFHSDPHPANIFVLESGELGLVDFGQAGELTDEDMTKLTRLFVDAATENVDAIPRRLRELGVRYAPEREQEFRAEVQVLFDRYYGMRLSDIDPLQVIREAFQLIYSLNLRLPSRFVMLDKAIAT